MFRQQPRLLLPHHLLLPSLIVPSSLAFTYVNTRHSTHLSPNSYPTDLLRLPSSHHRLFQLTIRHAVLLPLQQYHFLLPHLPSRFSTTRSSFIALLHRMSTMLSTLAMIQCIIQLPSPLLPNIASLISNPLFPQILQSTLSIVSFPTRIAPASILASANSLETSALDSPTPRAICRRKMATIPTTPTIPTPSPP